MYSWLEFKSSVAGLQKDCEKLDCSCGLGPLAAQTSPVALVFTRCKGQLQLVATGLLRYTATPSL